MSWKDILKIDEGLRSDVERFAPENIVESYEQDFEAITNKIKKMKPEQIRKLESKGFEIREDEYHERGTEVMHRQIEFAYPNFDKAIYFGNFENEPYRHGDYPDADKRDTPLEFESAQRHSEKFSELGYSSEEYIDLVKKLKNVFRIR